MPVSEDTLFITLHEVLDDVKRRLNKILPDYYQKYYDDVIYPRILRYWETHTRHLSFDPFILSLHLTLGQDGCNDKQFLHRRVFSYHYHRRLKKWRRTRHYPYQFGVGHWKDEPIRKRPESPPEFRKLTPEGDGL